MIFEELMATRKPAPKRPTKGAEAYRSSAHKHPAEDKAKVEKKQPYVGSLGEVFDEGCIEHGDIRYILEELPQDENVRLKKLQEYIVFSEILGKPKCKK